VREEAEGLSRAAKQERSAHEPLASLADEWINALQLKPMRQVKGDRAWLNGKALDGVREGICKMAVTFRKSCASFREFNES